jgi:hypothetical protein
MSKFILFLFNLLFIHNFWPTKCVINSDYIFWWTILQAKCILTSKFHAVEATTIYYYSKQFCFISSTQIEYSWRHIKVGGLLPDWVCRTIITIP